MKFSELIKSQKSLFCLFLFSGFLAVLWEISKPETKTAAPAEAQESADTYVPEGHVLVPIEVQNTEALDAILGAFGVVDLFQNSKLVARQVKILRAPLDPKKFAILVPSEQSANLVKADFPFFVTIHNPKRNRPQFLQSKKIKARIQYE